MIEVRVVPPEVAIVTTTTHITTRLRRVVAANEPPEVRVATTTTTVVVVAESILRIPPRTMLVVEEEEQEIPNITTKLIVNIAPIMKPASMITPKPLPPREPKTRIVTRPPLTNPKPSTLPRPTSQASATSEAQLFQRIAPRRQRNPRRSVPNSAQSWPDDHSRWWRKRSAEPTRKHWSAPQSWFFGVVRGFFGKKVKKLL